MSSHRPALGRPAVFATAVAAAFGSVFIASPPANADSPLCSDYLQCSESGRTDHGYATVIDVSHWGMYGGHNCTNYIAYMLGASGVAEPSFRLGNAAQWGPAAAAAGVAVDGDPAVGAVAWWSSGAGGLSWAGHVAWVERVTPEAITVSEDNYPYGPFDWRVIPRAGSGWPTGFLHFGARNAPVQPSIAAAPGGGTAVAAVRTDRSLALYTRPRAGVAWSVRTVAPAGSAFSAPSLVLGAGGLAEIAVGGPRSTLTVYGRAHADSPWTMEQVSGPGTITSAPTALLDSSGGLRVAVGGSGNSLDLYVGQAAAPRLRGSTSGDHSRRWTTAVLAGPGSVLSRPAMVAGAGGTTQVAVVGPHHSLVLHTGLPGGSWAVQTVSGAGTAYADPSLLAPAGGLQVATVGPGRTAQVHLAGSSDPAGTGWRVQPLSAAAGAGGPLALSAASVRRVAATPALASAPDAISPAPGVVETATITVDGRLLVTSRPATGSTSSVVVDPGT